MYVPSDKRRFFVTIREVEEDGTLGKSESFSIYESEKVLTRQKVVESFKELINSTHQGKSR